MRQLFVGMVVVLVVTYLLLNLAAWYWQERIVWQPPRLAQYPAAAARRIEYSAEDGQPLYGYLVGDPSRARGLLIAYHGNADLAAWLVPWANEVERRTGWAVLIPEYRGYGGLTGSPRYAASQVDARATYQLARHQLGVDSSRIALYGHSLGSAVASELATVHVPHALILVSPFTSARDMAHAMRALPLWALWGLVSRVQFDTRARVASLGVPVSVAHGDRDIVVPVWMGRAVHAAARIRGELLVVPGAGHNDVEAIAGPGYWAWLSGALEGRGTG
jgi:fermentation-respiration switch protein FrsA (DUF1100 family)